MSRPTDNEELLPVLDGPPKGPVVDHDDAPLTEDEIELGNALGEIIDIDDDEDDGGDLL